MVKNGKTAKKSPVALIIAIGALVALLLIVTLVTALKMNDPVILSGVHAGGVDLSGMTVEEAESALSEKITSVQSDTIAVTAGNDSFRVTFKDLGASYNSRTTAENAYAYGHTGFFSAIGPAVKSVFGLGTDLPLEVSINNRVFSQFMTENTDYDESVEADFEIIEGAVRVTNGKSAYTINPVTAKSAFYDRLKHLDFSPLAFNKEDTAPIPFDLDSFMENRRDEAVSATYYRDADGNIQVTEGYDKVVLDEKKAQDIIASHSAPGEIYDIPAEVEFAEYTSDELTEALFRDVLSHYETSFTTSNANRSHNVSLAASALHDKILLPGESLSYNETLGRRTPEAGYKMAGAYSNGETVQEYGGGICQISSTLYVAVLKANLKIEHRECHMFPVAYVPVGLDATVDYGTIDFIFSNDTPYPIKINSYTTEAKKAVCEIIGTKTEDFEVTFDVVYNGSVPYGTKEEEDPTLPVGETKVKEKGVNGTRYTTYRIVTVNGESERTKESQSYYIPQPEVILVGTLEGEVPTVPGEITPGETTPTVPGTENPTAPTTPSTPTTPTVPDAPVTEVPSVPTTPEVPSTSQTTPTVTEIPVAPAA